MFKTSNKFGTGKDYNINFLANQIKRISKSNSKIIHIPERKAEVQRLTCDATLSKKLGGNIKLISRRIKT